MYCPNCGTKLPDESRFCSECGSSLGGYQQTPDWGEVTQPLPGQPVFTQPEVNKPQKPPKGNGVTKLVVGFLVAVLVIAAVTVGVVALGQSGKEPMEALFAKGDWYYTCITQFDGTYDIRKASSDVEKEVIEVWDAIRSLEVREIEEDIYDRIRSSENVSMFMMDEDAKETMMLFVTPEGDMFVNYNDDNTRYFTGAQDLYYALKVFLPLGDETSLENCIPDGPFVSMTISFYDADMNLYDDVYVSDPTQIGQTVDRLQRIEAKYGGGLYLDFGGYRAMLGLTEEDGDFYYLEVYEEGSGDFPQRDWVYGFYEAVEVYDALWEELARIKGY